MSYCYLHATSSTDLLDVVDSMNKLSVQMHAGALTARNMVNYSFGAQRYMQEIMYYNRNSLGCGPEVD
jgi:hypothetical protein